MSTGIPKELRDDLEAKILITQFWEVAKHWEKAAEFEERAAEARIQGICHQIKLSHRKESGNRSQ